MTITRFPLIQLPRKSEAAISLMLPPASFVSINSTSEEVRSVFREQQHYISVVFPLIQLPRKSEDSSLGCFG